jgi:hypothetical protein
MVGAVIKLAAVAPLDKLPERSEKINELQLRINTRKPVKGAPHSVNMLPGIRRGKMRAQRVGRTPGDGKRYGYIHLIHSRRELRDQINIFFHLINRDIGGLYD